MSDFGVMIGGSRVVVKDDRGRERPLTAAELKVIGLQERAKALMRGMGGLTLGLLANYYLEVGETIAGIARSLESTNRLEAMSEGDRFLDWTSEHIRSLLAHQALLAEIEHNEAEEDRDNIEAGRQTCALFTRSMA
ncbi:MAG: hypothetical protein KGI26_04770 [Thaumarchaeota archaeon]|nr:hypothetical protein [Nitrososphaerota archaeon]